MRASLVHASWIVLAAHTTTYAQPMKGDASNGRQFAGFWCSGCHVIEPTATPSGRAAPDFSDVAKRRTTNSRKLVKFLYSQHKTMPNFEIELDDATDVATYIMSLRRR